VLALDIEHGEPVREQGRIVRIEQQTLDPRF
jgi:hypothetical protein